MCAEKKSNSKEKTFACCNFDGIAEMMKDCFPDDAGYSDCLAKMNKMQGKYCNPQNDKTEEDRQGCCG